MTVREANRLSVMRQIDKKILNIREASHELGLSTILPQHLLPPSATSAIALSASVGLYRGDI